jgi:site-specific recombinase XerD
VSFADGLSSAITLRSVTVAYGECRTQRLVLAGGERSWTVLGGDHRPVGPAEEFLEYLRVQRVSPNTVKSYARALALWWQYLEAFGLSWDAVTLQDWGGFLAWLRTGDGPQVVSIERRPARFAESTIAARLQAVMSCYRYHHFTGAASGGDLVRLVNGRGGGGYKPMLEHLARRAGRRQAVIRVRRPGSAAPPLLAPGQIERICDACAPWDAQTRRWRGCVRDRLLWALLAESGLRLGEALGLQHRDWHAGCGDTAFIEVVPRDHPHGVRVKGGGYRKLYVSAELDSLYGEYVWQLCEAGADLAAVDLDETCVFVNLSREPRFAPWRPESVYDLVQRLRHQLAGQVPAGWTPHWFRHSHASALLLAGVPVHVVSRRLGHADVQTTLNIYGHVTEDAELRAAADWKALTARWLAASPGAGEPGGCP